MSRRRTPGSTNYWPGFVDALTTLLLVFVFLLVVFVLAQVLLSQSITGKDETIGRLNRQVRELSDLLSLERQANASLRLDIAQLSSSLQSTVAERDQLQLDLQSARDRADGLSQQLARTESELEAAQGSDTVARDNLLARLAEIESLNRDLAALRQLRNELERQVAGLADSVEDLRAERAQLTGDLQRSRDRGEGLEQDVDAARGRIAALETELAALRERADGLAAELAASRDRVAELQAQLEGAQQQGRDLEGRLASSEGEAGRLAGELDVARRRIAALEGELATAGRRAAALERTIEQRDDEIAGLEKALADLNGRNRALAEALAEARRQADTLTGEVETARSRGGALQEELDEARLRVSELERELERRRAEMVSLSSDLELARSRIAELEDRSAEATAAAERQQAALGDAAARVAELEREARTARATIERLTAELDTSRQANAAIAERLAAARAELEERGRQLDAARDEAAARTAELGDLRDRSKALQAELADERERTILQQEEIEARDIRLSDLMARYRAVERDRQAAVATSAERGDRLDLLSRQLEILRSEVSRLAAALDAARERQEDSSATIVELRTQLNRALLEKVEELARYRSEFFGRLRQILAGRENIEVVGDRFVLQSEVLFDSGSAQLGPGGREELNKVAEILLDIIDDIPDEIDWILRVDGHTDQRPIATERFPSNWELSSARAVSVVKALAEQGIPRDRLAATGFGEFQPIDPTYVEEAYRRNRRIEFKLTER